MKKILSPKILLILILSVGAFLRFYQLSNNPPGLNWDEAAWGYNAYSLGIDARDEFGKFLPFTYIESYGDYKPPAYAYLDVIPVKLFGLNAFAVRFPSAILGTLTILLTYLLVKEIFKNRGSPKVEILALCSSLFLAISPWHIMLSRGAFEANVSTFFIVLGILLFLFAINRKPWIIILSAISFALSLYTFNTARVFVPLLVLVMAWMFRSRLLINWKQSIVGVLTGLIIVLPLLPFLLSPQAKLRFKEVNIFSDINVVKTSNQEIANDNGAIWSKVIHNRRVLYSLDFIKHYADNFNPNFLFISGDGNPRFSTQDVGELYIFDIPFLFIGVYFLFKNREGHYWLIPVWILLGIIPAATARETPHALRIETIVPTLQVLSALGFVEVVYVLGKRKQLIATFALIILGLNFLYFFHGYLSHYAREYSSEWQYPYKQIVTFAASQNQFKNVEITQALGRPYIYFLLYNRFDPKIFRQTAKVDREVYGFVHVRSLGRYRFVDSIDTTKLNSNTLYFDVPSDVPSSAKVLAIFKLLDGTKSLVAYETDR